MKYKRHRARVSKYISHTESKHRQRPYRGTSLKKRSSWAAALVMVCFALTRISPAAEDFIKKVFTQSQGVILENSEFLNTAGDYIAGFCLEYLKGGADDSDPAQAVAASVRSDADKASSGQDNPKSESADAGAPAADDKERFVPLFPCDGEISSEFGERVHPISAEVSFHNGIDIALDEGDEVRACFGGEVTKSEYNEFSGNHIIIQHMDGYTSSYAHMSKLLVPEGKVVNKGDIIGLAGSTGNATGPHLHFEIRQNGTALDPERMIKQSENN